MPVLINDFDVADEPPQPNEPSVQKAPAPTPPPVPALRPLSLEDAEQLVQQIVERRRRTWAD
jgi:hypothetical protein